MTTMAATYKALVYSHHAGQRRGITATEAFGNTELEMLQGAMERVRQAQGMGKTVLHTDWYRDGVMYRRTLSPEGERMFGKGYAINPEG
jgi:hypothetical protein